MAFPMDKQITTDTGRIIRVCAMEGKCYIQLKDASNNELTSVVLWSDELQQLFNLINEATGVV